MIHAFVFPVALILQQVASAAIVQCTPADSAPSLDHVIIAVRDLERANAAFRRPGFRIKPGRLHANGLLNSHIKFREGTEIELMTVRGEPRDEMARRYAALLADGDGGVYVALKVGNLKQAEREAAAAGLEIRHSASGPWQFVSFPSKSAAAAIFFTSGDAVVRDVPEIFQHDPPATRVDEAWLEGDVALGDLLARLGAARCGTVNAADGRVGQRWLLKRGSVVIVPARRNIRPRVLGVVLASPVTASRTIQPLREFWVRYHKQ